jgi:acetyltransferase-like isoleucine patch superfamily enzyme
MPSTCSQLEMQRFDVKIASVLRWLYVKAITAWYWATSRLSARIWLSACDAVGAGTKVYGTPHVENRGRIVIGTRVRISCDWAPVELVTGSDGVIEIGDGTFINYGSLISARKRVRIGAAVMVGNYSIIGDTDVPGIGEPRLAPAGEPREIEIGDGAWVAARVTVLPGTRIGAGAVIAAGSVVAGEIPAGAVAGGIPARVLKGGISGAQPAPPAPSAEHVAP